MKLININDFLKSKNTTILPILKCESKNNILNMKISKKRIISDKQNFKIFKCKNKYVLIALKFFCTLIKRDILHECIFLELHIFDWIIIFFIFCADFMQSIFDLITYARIFGFDHNNINMHEHTDSHIMRHGFDGHDWLQCITLLLGEISLAWIEINWLWRDSFLFWGTESEISHRHPAAFWLIFFLAAEIQIDCVFDFFWFLVFWFLISIQFFFIWVSNGIINFKNIH